MLSGITYATFDSDTKNNLTGGDVLTDPRQCALDARLMHSLGVNTIRVYQVDNALNHTGCMHVFKSFGIYLLLSLSTAENIIDWVSRMIKGPLAITIFIPLLFRRGAHAVMRSSKRADTETLVTSILDTGYVQ